MLLEPIEEAIRNGDWQEATKLAKRLVADHPTNAQVRAYLALSYMHQASFELAAVELKSAVALNPHFWQAELILAQCLDVLGQYREALEVARKGLKERPSDPKFNSLVRGLERHVDQPVTDGWERSVKPIMYNIDFKEPEAEPKPKPKKATKEEQPKPESQSKPELRLWVSNPKPTT